MQPLKLVQKTAKEQVSGETQRNTEQTREFTCRCLKLPRKNLDIRCRTVPNVFAGSTLPFRATNNLNGLHLCLGGCRPWKHQSPPSQLGDRVPPFSLLPDARRASTSRMRPVQGQRTWFGRFIPMKKWRYCTFLHSTWSSSSCMFTPCDGHSTWKIDCQRSILHMEDRLPEKHA